ncbi:MAG: Methyltransf 11 protein [Magnetococcales bacterium]|nr:Methyltransf 11 protein [Magnetococcales bacterium]HIJ82930.1 methyltransferase domain-containing protein [Magnetococcales bacterium]
MLKKMLARLFGWIPWYYRVRLLQELVLTLEPEQARDAMQKTIRDLAGTMPVDQSLRFLFRLDAFLYTIQGRQSVRYDKGLHTKYRHTRYIDFFLERVQPGQRVMDIGCGGGLLAFNLAQKGAIVVGMDISPEKILEAQQKHVHPNLTFRQGDALKEFESGVFDCVVLSNVLEHLDQRVVFLQSVMDRYQPSLLLVRVPAFERDWRVPLKKELGVEWRLDPTHEIEYTQESLTREMNASGLKIRHWEVRWGEFWVEVVREVACLKS